MKKLLGLCLALAMVASLSFGPIGCGGKDKTKTPTASPTGSPSPTTSPSPSPSPTMP